MLSSLLVPVSARGKQDGLVHPGDLNSSPLENYQTSMSRQRTAYLRSLIVCDLQHASQLSPGALSFVGPRGREILIVIEATGCFSLAVLRHRCPQLWTLSNNLRILRTLVASCEPKSLQAHRPVDKCHFWIFSRFIDATGLEELVAIEACVRPS